MKIYCLIFAIVISNLFLSCGEITKLLNPECTTLEPYDFEIPVKYSPNKYVFAVGDTIKIVFEFSEEFTDLTENKKYLIKDYKEFYPAVRFIRLDSTVKNKYFFQFADTCNMILKNLFVQHWPNEHNDAGIGFDFDYRDGRYYASLSFIMKKKGIYYFEIKSEAKPEFPGTFAGQCGARNVYFCFKNTNDANFDLVKWILYPNADPRLIDIDGKSNFENIAGYAFEVK